jgi:hypothetical protein
MGSAEKPTVIIKKRTRSDNEGLVELTSFTFMEGRYSCRSEP